VEEVVGRRKTERTTEDTEYTESGDEKMGITTNEVNPLLFREMIAGVAAHVLGGK